MDEICRVTQLIAGSCAHCNESPAETIERAGDLAYLRGDPLNGAQWHAIAELLKAGKGLSRLTTQRAAKTLESAALNAARAYIEVHEGVA